MTTILSNFPGQGFTVAAGPGDIFEGGAVGFAPKQDCSLASVTLLLSGYNAKMPPHFALQLLNDGPGNRPGGAGFPNFVAPPGNDGSPAEFTFDMPGKADLKAGKVYWIFAYGGITNDSFGDGFAATWIGGAVPTGNAEFKGSWGFVESNFTPSSNTPAFKINVT